MGDAGLSFADPMIESFFAKIKTELLHNCQWSAYEEINRAIIEYCENFYNSIRPQIVFHGRTPLEAFRRLTSSHHIRAIVSGI